MSKIEIGTSVLAGLALVGWFMWWRLRSCETKLAVDNQEIRDAEIRAQVHNMSGNALDADLAKRIGADANKPKS